MTSDFHREVSIIFCFYSGGSAHQPPRPRQALNALQAAKRAKQSDTTLVYLKNNIYVEGVSCVLYIRIV